MSVSDVESRSPRPQAGEKPLEGHPRRLINRVAFITGASRGLGEAIAHRLAAEGARVALAARNEGDCKKIASKISKHGGEAMAIGCDVTLAVSVSGAIAAVVARWGRIDILVNNAGLAGPTPLEEPDDSRWNAVLATNLTAVFRMTREAAPFLPMGGRVLNLSSVAGRFGIAGWGAYCASKHGVIGLTRALALELAPRQITVNAICPGWVETDMAREQFRRLARNEGGSEDRGREMAAGMAPLARVLEPEEVAGLVAYLSSEEARSVTGQAIVIDGGQVMP
ncbi:MAG TPA: SDR family NAD(P)-dependent oxidoreductase [Thermoanaerobaculia bacterium]|nr:SDR family NAD(P)-dependent oxidoreductase [Thermoanaerobaculia bacterium]